MKVSELALRYAKAAFDLATESKNRDKVFADLRALDGVFTGDPEIVGFLTSPIIKQEDRISALKKSIADRGISTEVVDLVLLLAKKGRLGIFHELVHAFETQSDVANNVCRGTVRSATALGQTERAHIEKTVEGVLKKKVILSFKTDASVIGGLVAEVGSYTFDDSISSHLKRMNEELKRRTV